MEGNQQKMREALEELNCVDTRGLKRLLYELVESDIFDGGQINKIISAVKKATRVLSAPPRNCDVGKAEEQTERFKLFCNRRECVTCELNRRSPFRFGCFSAWAQMPYEADK